VELCIPQPRFEDSDEELIEDKPVDVDNDDDSIEEIIPSYLPPSPPSSKVPQDSKPILDSGLGLVPPPNGHGRPVGTYTDKELARPSTTTQRPANQRPPSNQRPANQRPTNNRPTNKRPSTVYHPTQPQCIWAYFGCGARHDEATCKQRFDDCVSGESFDYKICKDVDLNPHAYLVPHPEDCTKFYSCQNLGWKGGYIAHLMDCPPTTGFDTKLRICNYIRALPRCNKEKERKLFKEVEGLIARQTRFKKQILDVPSPVITRQKQIFTKPRTLPSASEIRSEIQNSGLSKSKQVVDERTVEPNLKSKQTADFSSAAEPLISSESPNNSAAEMIVPSYQTIVILVTLFSVVYVH